MQSGHLSVTTPLMEIDPARVDLVWTDTTAMRYYQKEMSRAVWRPAPGRKLAFLVIHGEHLLGVIFLASPVMRLTARDEHLFPNAPKGFKYGTALRNYMDMSVCVGAQPIAWHWNIGKLCALIAPTLGDCIEERYPDDEFKGVTTTSLWGRGSQYNRIYKYLGKTKGFGHEHISDERYHEMLDRMKTDGLTIPGSSFGDGSNPRMKRIQAYYKAYPDERPKNGGLFHGNQRGVYYHPAVAPGSRQMIIEHWHDRWGRPRYERTKDETPPYTSGTTTSTTVAV